MRVVVSACAVLMAGCASVPVTNLPESPAALRPPAGQSLFLEARATGVQIYECTPKGEWAFKAPDATLFDPSGATIIGKHYAGPTWESNDGSKVVGGVAASDPGPDANAIPWLLLTAKSTSGGGVFGPTKSVQRLRTDRGKAPTEPCNGANAGKVARVPYTAVYYFYGEGKAAY